MNEEISEKLDELIYTIKNNPEVKELLKLKEAIYSNEDLKKDLDDYRNSYNSIELKSKIINNDLVKKYRQLENKLYFTVLDMNKILNEIVEKGSCSK